jgi:hypothetical protein
MVDHRRSRLSARVSEGALEQWLHVVSDLFVCLSSRKPRTNFLKNLQFHNKGKIRSNSLFVATATVAQEPLLKLVRHFLDVV